MSTEEVEQLITIPMEQSLNSTPGLDVMRSKTVPGLSAITLFFKRGTDSLEARQLVQRAGGDRDPEPARVGGHPVGAAAALGHEPRAQDRPDDRPLQPDRPLDDRLLDDPLAADGGARRRQRERLGRPLEATPAAVRPGEAARAPRQRGLRPVGGLRRARLRPAQVHRRRQEPGRRVHREPEPAPGHPPRPARVRPGDAGPDHDPRPAQARRHARSPSATWATWRGGTSRSSATPSSTTSRASCSWSRSSRGRTRST